MGGFLGIGNSSAKTDRGNQLAGINAAWSVYNRGLPMSDALSKTGTDVRDKGISSLEDAKKYWQTLLTGNRPAVAAATAPAINAINEQTDAQKAETAQMGTGRSGGVAALNQKSETDRMTAVDHVLTGVQPEAAKELSSVAGAETQAGQAAFAQALQALGLDAGVASEIINSSKDSRKISQEANNAVKNAWSSFMGAFGF